MNRDPIEIVIPVPAFQPHRWMLESLADPHRFRMHRWHRRARKTTLGLNKLIKEACRTTNRIYGYIGPTYKQAKAIIVRDPLMLTRYLPPEVLRKPFHETELYAEFRSGSILRILGADEPDSIRGPRFDGVVLDEFAMQKPEIFTEILLPVLTENDGWCDFLFTPKGRNHAYQFWKRGGNPAYPDWVSFDLTVEQSGLIAPEKLDHARQEMGEDLYRQEMLCEFLDNAQTVFRGMEQCIGGSLEDPIDGRRYVMGVDLGRHHDATVLLVADVRTRHVVAYQRLTESHWALQKQAIAMLCHRYGDPLILVDSTGVGSPIEEDLRDLGLSVEGVTFTVTTKRDLVDGLRIALAQRLITFPKIDQLLTELRDYEIHVGPTGQVTYSAPEGEGYYDDAVMALALVVRGLKGDLYPARIEVSDTDYDAALSTVPANGGYGFR